ncbi:MAG: phosphate signaling complex protein PhoU, partial [Alphaproteobacteria bacterium]|nr:phosphate signaling complex protein PhoU [Alphaproteobacteria bacterium]
MNETHHIQSVFDRDLEAIQAMIMKMGGLVEAAIVDAAKSLETRDEELALKVCERDKAIDALEEQVNEEASRVIALRAPTASDLRTVLTVMKISGNLERCGDYAKNLAKRTSVLVKMQPPEGATTSLRRMAREVEAMMKDVLDAYIRRDVELAEEVRRRDQDVDQMY